MMKKDGAWKVYFDGTLWCHAGRDHAGREVPLNRTFAFGSLEGYLPALCLCGKGLVLDLCLSMDGGEAQAWIDRLQAIQDPEAQERAAAADFPLRLGGHPDISAELKGRPLRRKHGSSTVWYPFPPEGEKNGAKACRAVEHYELDRTRAWVIYRTSLAWPGERRPAGLSGLTVTLTPERQEIPGPIFTAEPGKVVPFTDPSTGERRTLTVQEAAWEELTVPLPMEEELEPPRRFQSIAYTVTPEAEEDSVLVRDGSPGDRPRRKDAAVGVIGGADGPTGLIFARRRVPHIRSACSSLYFEKPEAVEWRLVFRRRPWPSVTLELPL